METDLKILIIQGRKCVYGESEIDFIPEFWYSDSFKHECISEIYSQMVGEEGQREQKLNATCREDKTEFDYVRLSWLYERLYNVIWRRKSSIHELCLRNGEKATCTSQEQTTSNPNIFSDKSSGFC